MTDVAKDANSAVAEELSTPMTIGVEAYISEDYARAERDKLWRKVWQQVGRVEELPEVGSYLTYDILDDSIIVVRTGANEFRAHHNVCMHRGRRLIDTPEGAKNALGRTRKSFVCGFHGWTYGLDGACTHIREQQDWRQALTPDNTHLRPVRVDTWGGWLWINMDPDCEPLADYLFPAAKILKPFGLEKMRYKWRKWLYFDCNWKVALEAFNETYHVYTTHPEFNKFGEFKGWAKAQGRHSNIGYDAPEDMEATKSKIRLGIGADPRVSTAEMQVYTMEETNATTTQTLVNAAKRLVDELPEGTPADKVHEALAGVGPPRRRGARRDLADHPARHPRAGRHRVADLPQLPDRAGPDQRAVLRSAAAPQLQPRQVHLRGLGVRAVPQRRRATNGMGIHPGR